MITPSINILKAIKTESEPMIHNGFQLIAKKLADQLKNDIENTQYSIIKTDNIKNIAQAKSTITEIEKMAESDYFEFTSNNGIDTVIALYNEQRPTRLKIDPGDYKIFTNQLAYFQICSIATYLDPDIYENKHDYAICKGVSTFFDAKTECYRKKSASSADGYILTIQLLLFAIDEALAAFDSLNGTSTNPHKTQAQMFSGYPNFEKYLKSLFIQYETASLFYPELLDPAWKSYFITSHLHRKHQDMTNYTYHKHKAYIDDIIDPIMDDLMFLRNTRKLDQPSIAKEALQSHIENLRNTITNKSKIKKVITVEIIEYLIELYEQILRRRYQPICSTRNNSLMAKFETSTSSDEAHQDYNPSKPQPPQE